MQRKAAKEQPRFSSLLALAGCTPMGPGSSQTPDTTQSLEDRDDSATCIRDGERFLFQRFRWSLAAILLSMGSRSRAGDRLDD
jgi:hypothetical protein